VALSDELRREAGEVLQALAAQGIGFKILSGDNPETVRATVGHVPLPLACEPVISGSELALASDPMNLIEQRSVFGRLTPQQKIEVVTTLQARGRHVAMIGDGINDILSIKRADLGIAMGEGSSAAKTVAGLVLENNNFQLLPATLDEGRTILRNLRRAAKLFLLKNVYSLFLIVMALAIFRLDFPYRPQQVTLLNALTIGIPALIITMSKDRFAAPSRPGFLREVGWFVLPSGAVIGIAGLVIFLISARGLGDDLRTQRTLLLTTLVLLGLGSLLRVLTHGESQPVRSDHTLRWLAFAALPVYGMAMYVPLTADFFELTPLTVSQWGLVLEVAVPAFLVCKVFDWLGLE
jgi:cation-transporting ATPase E